MSRMKEQRLPESVKEKERLQEERKATTEIGGQRTDGH